VSRSLHTKRTLRTTVLSADERLKLAGARYHGNPVHKRNPGDFGLHPPADPRPDKTLCDEAGIVEKATADRLFAAAREMGIVSTSTTSDGSPKQLYVVDNQQVFEFMSANDGTYHGYPIRKSNALFDVVSERWEKELRTRTEAGR
jgi:hypothetical protein